MQFYIYRFIGSAESSHVTSVLTFYMSHWPKYLTPASMPSQIEESFECFSSKELDTFLGSFIMNIDIGKNKEKSL